jgi:hypothetical protein
MTLPQIRGSRVSGVGRAVVRLKAAKKSRIDVLEIMMMVLMIKFFDVVVDGVLM